MKQLLPVSVGDLEITLSWFIDRTIAVKIVVCFGCVIAVGLIAGALTYRSLARVETTEAWTSHTFEILYVSKEIRVGILKQESDVRGYILTHDKDFLDRANEEYLGLQAAMAHLRELNADNPIQTTRIDSLERIVKTWRAQLPTKPGPAADVDTANVGAEGVLNRMLNRISDIEAEEKRLLEIRSKDKTDAIVSGYRWNALGPAISVVIALLFGTILHRLIAVPIARLTRAMGSLAEGETNTRIPNTGWKEEIGAMSRALAVFQTEMIESARLRGEQKDMRARTDRDRAALMTAMADRFEDVVGSIVQSVSASTGEMQSSAESLLDLAEWTTDQVQAVTGATKQASSTMNAVADETQSLLDSVGEINIRMAQSAEIAGQAVTEADRTTVTIEGLSQSAKRIGVIVALINDVARQTNLLALNATIEAARAGEAGRGFAVVAVEVKNLADQTARATDDIRRQIEDIQGAALGSTSAIAQISHTIGEMARLTAEITLAGGAQGEATRDMVLGTQATARATAEVSSQLDQVSQGAVTTGAAATRVLSAAKDLAQQSTLLREEARRFVASVRAG